MLKQFMQYVDEVENQNKYWLLRLNNGWRIRFKADELQQSLIVLRKS